MEEPTQAKDWSRLHAALAAMPAGAWTSYSDVAELMASHQVPVGQHLATTAGFLNAHRVLSVSGKVAENFKWLDATDTRDVREVLQSEGIRFNTEGQAEKTQRLSADDLAQLIGEVTQPNEGQDDGNYGWRLQRLLRYLRHFYLAPGHRLPEDEARRLAVEEGYDVRGTAGFYQGSNARLRMDGDDRVLTDAGYRFFESRRYLLED